MIDCQIVVVELDRHRDSGHLSAKQKTLSEALALAVLTAYSQATEENP